MTIELKPNEGWKSFDRNSEVADFIDTQYNQVLKLEGWKYLNFLSDTAVFESSKGNNIYLEFSKSNTENYDLIRKMLFDYSCTSDSLFQSLEQDLIDKFQLKRITL